METRLDKDVYPLVDVLRLVAMFGIVGCHLDLPQMTRGAWFVKGFTDYNVGVFAALAGFFFFHGRDVRFGEYLRQRIGRLAIPYLVWFVIYQVIVANVFLLLTSGEMRWWFLTPQGWVKILLGQNTGHLWFLASLLWVQSLLFGVRRWFSRGWWKGVIALVVGFGGLQVADAWPSWWTEYPLRLLGFFLLGAFLLVFENVGRRWLVFAVPFLFWGLCHIGYDVPHRYILQGCIVVPLCLIAVMVKPVWLDPYAERLRMVGEVTFVVYLVHPLITITFREVLRRVMYEQSAAVFLADQAVSFVLALGCAWVLTRFKAFGWLWGSPRRRIGGEVGN